MSVIGTHEEKAQAGRFGTVLSATKITKPKQIMPMFNTSEEKKTEYWNHFVEDFKPHPQGFTKPRLAKIKALIWGDADFWFDVVHRHGGQNKTPKELDYQTYNHCFGNMAGMIRQTMQEQRML